MIPLADARAALGAIITTGCSAQATAVFPAHLPVFAGHFPGFAVVPGVATLALLVATHAGATQSSVMVRQVARCKWQRPCFPGDALDIHISWTIQADRIELRGLVQRDQAPVCEAMLTLERLDGRA